MKATLLDGAGLAKELRDEASNQVDELGFQPMLATILVGGDKASKLYVDLKSKACDEVGVKTVNHELEADTHQSQLMDLIRSLNEDEEVNGILLQLPLPDGIDAQNVIPEINPLKDVDGFTPLNLGRLASGDESMASATPKGIIRLLEEYGVGFKGRDIVIINHSVVVGRPLSLLFLNRDATVSICHEYTRDLGDYTRRADIVVSAAGVPGLVNGGMVQEDCVVVDAGISKTDEGVAGDVEFEEVAGKASYITPVPGGVGPMTIASLIENTLSAARKQNVCVSYDKGCLS